MTKSPPDWPFGAQLLPAIVQDHRSGEVLMLGYMNELAYRQTLSTQRVTFFSRSRQRLWEKGETSGNTLCLHAVAFDCDADTLLVLAEPRGPVCHQNTHTCFGVDPPRPDAMAFDFLRELETIIDSRMQATPDPAPTNAQPSYVAALTSQGLEAAAQKLGEESVECVIASLRQDNAQFIGESADLLFHLAILLRMRGLSLRAVIDHLAYRHAQRIHAVQM